MKIVIPILVATSLWILCAGTAPAQTEGKHLGSTEDVTRTSKTLHTGASVDATDVPESKTAGGKYGKETFVEEEGMYLDEGWLPGYAVLMDKTCLDALYLRYDIYNQQMQFLHSTDTVAFAKPEELDYLYIGNLRFIFVEFNRAGVVEKGYFEVLADGDCKLLLRRSVTVHVKDIASDGSARDEYQRESAYFLKKGDQPSFEIKASKKSVLAALQDEEQKVGEFMNNNKLKVDNAKDLIEVVGFYNSLP
jgi:hypothetical protein